MWSSRAMLKHRLFELEIQHLLHTSLSGGRSHFPELPCQDNIHPQGSSALLPQTFASEAPVLPFSLKDSPRRAGNFNTRDMDCFFFSTPGQNVFFLISDDNPVAVMIVTTQLGRKKKKSAEIRSRNSPAPAVPCCAHSWRSSVPWNRSTAWMNLPITLSYHMPCLYDTICFLLQLFSSVVKHSSEMRSSTFIPSQNPSLAPWVVYVCFSPGSKRLQLHHCDLASALCLSLSLSPLQSEFSRKAMPFFQTITSKARDRSPDQKLGLGYLCKAGLLLEEGLMSH